MKGWSFISQVLKVFPGSVSACIQVLSDGNLLSISPGGVREAQFGNHYYNLIWAGRVGFAKVAKQAKVPIIPVFTQNIREAFRTVQIFPNFFRYIYDTYKIPLMVVYGGFPVKLKTIIGKPIYFDSNASVQDIAEKVCILYCHQIFEVFFARLLKNWKKLLKQIKQFPVQ